MHDRARRTSVNSRRSDAFPSHARYGRVHQRLQCDRHETVRGLQGRRTDESRAKLTPYGSAAIFSSKRSCNITPSALARVDSTMQTPQVVSDASAWKGCDYADNRRWIVELTSRHVAELDAAAAACSNRGLMWSDIRREDFALPTLATDIREWAQQINHGRGFLLVKGLPVERLNNDQVRSVFWGIGLHL